MPTAEGKGKIPHSQVCEYDPNLEGALGMPREKHARGTSKSRVMNHKPTSSDAPRSRPPMKMNRY